MTPVSWPCVGRAHQRNNGFSQYCCLGESCPSSFSLKPNNWVPLHMSPVPFKLLSPCCISDGVSPISLCTVLLRGTPWDSSSLSLPQLQFPLVLQPGVMGLLFMAPKPWAGGPAVGLGPFTPKGSPPQWKYYSWFLFTTHGCGTSLFLAFVSPTHQCGFHSFWLQVVLNDAFYSLVLILIWLSTHDLDTANLCFYSLDA